jgi:tetratricopeptide (TPR) repeat protein
MLMGTNPFDQSAGYSVVPWQIEAIAKERSKAAPSMREHRGDTPWDLESIVRKCLAPDPGHRYQAAEHVADDLRRFLDDRPLNYAPELSRLDRARKFARRHPRLSSAAPIVLGALLIVTLLGALLIGTGNSLRATRNRLSVASAQQRRAAHEAGMVRSLCLINTAIDLADNLSQGIEECQKTLAIYDVPGLDGAEHPDWTYLDQAERLRLAEDRRELLLLLAGAQARLSHGQPDVVCQALDLLSRAQAIPGLAPSRALFQERARFLALIGKHEEAELAQQQAERTPAGSARDHYLLATAYIRQGTRASFVYALGELNVALERNSRDYWSLVQRGICQMELGNLVAAAGDFGTCIGLWPDFSWGYFNRGCALDRCGRKEEAVADYSEAINRDPSFLPAHLNRGLALLELKRYQEALTDFQSIDRPGLSDPTIEAGLGMALAGLGRTAEADKAFDSALEHSVSLEPPARYRLLWTYGFAVANRLPHKAKAAFARVLRDDPSNPQALYGCATLAMARNDLTTALDFFDRTLKAKPDLLEAMQYRAIALARLGQFEKAEKEINHCLGLDAENGATLYAAACVASLASNARRDSNAAAQACSFLEKARSHGVDLSKAATDPDLEPLRPHPRFKTVLSEYKAPGPPG